MDKLPAKPGDSLVNVLACFPDLEELKRDFQILYFLDFCAGLDALVLHERLFSVGPVTSLTGIVNPVVPELVKSGTLQTYRLEAKNRQDFATRLLKTKPAQEVMSQHTNRLDSRTFGEVIASISELAVDVALEEFFDVPFVLWAHVTPIYLNLPSVKQRQRATHLIEGELAKKYNDLKQTLFDLRQSLSNDEVLRIPPIALQALSAARDLESVGEIALDLRDKYRRVRKLFSELDEVLQSPDETLKKKVKTKAKIVKSISKLFETDELDAISTATSFGSQLNNLAKADGILKDGADLSDINWKYFVGWALDKAQSAYWKLRLRPLHATKRRYLSISNADIAKVVDRHFGHQVTNADVEFAKKYVEEVERLRGVVRAPA